MHRAIFLTTLLWIAGLLVCLAPGQAQTSPQGSANAAGKPYIAPPPVYQPAKTWWRLTSKCPYGADAANGWWAEIGLNVTDQHQLYGWVAIDALKSKILDDAGDYGDPAFRSALDGNKVTLVLHPADWPAVIELTGQWDGSIISGTAHHEGSDDCAFEMTPPKGAVPHLPTP